MTERVNVSPEWKLARASNQFKDWREKVFERDNYKCRCCGSEIDLVPHHIASFISCKSRRFFVSNGISLCGEHHRQFHKIYGRTKNNQRQVEEFISIHSTENSNKYDGVPVYKIPLQERRKSLYLSLRDMRLSEKTLRRLFLGLRKSGEKLNDEDKAYIQILLGRKVDSVLWQPPKDKDWKSKRHKPVKSKFYNFYY